MAAPMFRHVVCILLIFLAILSVNNGEGVSEDAQGGDAASAGFVKHINLEDLQEKLGKGTKYILVYVYETSCTECLLDLQTIGAVKEEVEDMVPELSGFEVYSTFLADGMRQYGLQDPPGVVFFRNGSPVPYEEVSSTKRLEASHLITWLLTAKKETAVTLNDGNFEHDTQASTGATTGDWLVLFYDSSCAGLLPRWETLAISLKGKRPLGKVDKSTSPNLVKRFKIEKCPAIILFRQGKMYHYDLPGDDTKMLATFAMTAYQNAKSEKVPKELSPFDKLVEFSVELIKAHPVITGVTGGAIFFILLTILFLTGRQRPHHHED